MASISAYDAPGGGLQIDLELRPTSKDARTPRYGRRARSVDAKLLEIARRAIALVEAASVTDAYATGVALALEALRDEKTVLDVRVADREIARMLRDPELRGASAQARDRLETARRLHKVYVFDAWLDLYARPDGPVATLIRDCEARAKQLADEGRQMSDRSPARTSEEGEDV